MKNIISLFITSLVLTMSLNVQAGSTYDFTGDFDISNWQITTESNGAINSYSSGLGVELISGDDNSGNESFQRMEITLAESSVFEFEWNFETTDTKDLFYGESYGDSFGYSVNGIDYNLSEFSALDNAGTIQGFEVISNLNAGDVFGFFQYSLDSSYGAATTYITNASFTSAVSVVPEPSLLALMLSGLGLIGIMASRRKEYS